jgi:hypothetical protein
MTHVLSVDPGVHSAWALWERSRLARHGRLENADVCSVFALLGEILSDWRGASVIVEGQWLRQHGRNPGTHFGAVLRLIESRCAWHHAAELAGADVEVIDPGRWIPAVSRGAPGDTPAERVRWICDRRFPGVAGSNDEAAAIMLGAWWLARRGTREAA